MHQYFADGRGSHADDQRHWPTPVSMLHSACLWLVLHEHQFAALQPRVSCEHLMLTSNLQVNLLEVLQVLFSRLDSSCCTVCLWLEVMVLGEILHDCVPWTCMCPVAHGPRKLWTPWAGIAHPPCTPLQPPTQLTIEEVLLLAQI